MNTIDQIKAAERLTVGDVVQYIGSLGILKGLQGKVVGADDRSYGQVEIRVDFGGYHINCYRLNLRKIMTGIELYEMYYSENQKQGVGIDDWDDLEPSDRNAWDAVAEKVQLKLEKKKTKDTK